MSQVKKSAGFGAVSDQPVPAGTLAAHSSPWSAQQQQAFADELLNLQQSAQEAGCMAFLLNYSLDSARVFQELRDASNGSEAMRAELRRACPDWGNPDAMSGFESATTWLAAELHIRTCILADGLRNISRPGGAA